MDTPNLTLDLIVRLASLGTAGISVFGIFYTGIIVKSLPNNVSEGKLSAVRMYKNMCIVIAIICALSGALNAFFNMQKVQDAKNDVAEIESSITNQADSLKQSREAIGRDLDELMKILEEQPGDNTLAEGVLKRIDQNVNSLTFKPYRIPD